MSTPILNPIHELHAQYPDLKVVDFCPINEILRKGNTRIHLESLLAQLLAKIFAVELDETMRLLAKRVCLGMLYADWENDCHATWVSAVSNVRSLFEADDLDIIRQALSEVFELPTIIVGDRGYFPSLTPQDLQLLNCSTALCSCV